LIFQASLGIVPVNLKGYFIKSLAFICGPALGHVSRLFQLAKRIKRQSGAAITFFVPHYSAAADFVIGDAFEIVKIPIPDDQRSLPFEIFADRMETHFKNRRFDLIVHDGCPLRWFSVLKFPDCPRVFLTNVFLTGHVSRETFQNRWFENEAGKKVLQKRRAKGLPPIQSVFDLYDADRVLLVDPPALFPKLKLPSHFSYCGPIFWSTPKAIPDALRNERRFTLISMGSTGKRSIDDDFLKQVRNFTRSEQLIYAGLQARDIRSLKELDRAFKLLPLNRILDRADAVVTQGGSGSSYQALFHGAPVIAFPTHINQQILGRIIEQAGLGVSIGLNENISRLEGFDMKKLIKTADHFKKEHLQRSGPAQAAGVIEKFL